MIKLNDLAAFFIELISLILLARWAYSIPDEKTLKVVSAIGTVIIFSIIWGLFFSPKAKYGLSGSVRWILEFAILLFPYIQFINIKVLYIIVAAVIIFVNLFIQARFGRAD